MWQHFSLLATSPCLCWLELLCGCPVEISLDDELFRDFELENGVFSRFDEAIACGDEDTESITYFCLLFPENQLFGERKVFV